MKRGLLLVLSFWIISFSTAQSVAGDIAFVGYSADGDDGFAFVTFVEIPSNTILYFTDDDWNGTVFSTNEGAITWTNDSGSPISSGTVITINNAKTAPSASIGSAIESDSGFDIALSVEELFAFIGTDDNTPTTFLTALSTNDYAAGGSVLPSNLTIDDTAIEMDNKFGAADDDVATYSGSLTCNTTIAACRQQITDLTTNPGNWITEEGAGDQHNNSIAPDFPDDVPSNFSGSALPVELISFKVKLKNNDPNLTWQTASETNNSHFQIEHSSTGQNFEIIGKIEGAGTTFEIQNYSYTHEAPSTGINYYRLKQVDFDGNFEYSKTISVFVKGSENWNLRPTQSRDELIVNWSDDFSAKAVSIFDLNGKMIFDKKLDFESEELRIETSTFPVGTYILKMQTDRTISSKRFFKIQ